MLIGIPRKGRAAALNTPNPFESLHIEVDPQCAEEHGLSTETQFFSDASKSILSRNSSPDLFFDFSINPYRGCEHGCIYCYARPTHEYLGFSAGVDFESKILVKTNAPELLAAAFSRPSWKPQVICFSGNTDPYQPVERKLEITRQCLDVFRKYGNPVGLITKNYLVTRDIDILSELAANNLVTVTISITSLRDDLIGEMEPRTSRPSRRLRAIEMLSSAGIPVGVNVAPVIPGLTDEEMPEILKAARDAGATFANYLIMRLPGNVEQIFLEWLNRTNPMRAARVTNRIKQIRDGKMSDSRFGSRHRGEGEWAAIIKKVYNLQMDKLLLQPGPPELRTDLFCDPQSTLQQDLFGKEA
ncbi:MAG: PA0069 family radical SAM protein [Rhodothermales bacterium]|nr:PA0069 family radical SAM protein [Rhodothermales bacterium]